MKCPFCGVDNDKVADTRPSDDGASIRRRRQCCNCKRRFTTYERAETITIRVVKRDGTRLPFDPQKIRQGIERACWKRPVSTEQILALIADVENTIDSQFDSEVDTKTIGQMVMDRLQELDQVAYVRFASVYREFQGAQDFAKELNKMLNP